jgi:hypothetical protein
VKKKILLVNDTYDDSNLGCKATTNALYELIDEYLDDHIVSDVIKLYHTERNEITGIIPRRFKDFHALAKKIGAGIIPPVLEFDISRIKSCDIVIINGEGSIYKDVLKCRYQLFLAYISKTVYNKAVYIVNHTAEISFVKDIIKEVYAILDGIAVREPFSLNELKNIGITNVVLAPDAVFKYKLKASSRFSSRLPHGFNFKKDFIIIGGSSLNNPLYEKWYGKWDYNSFIIFIKKIKEITGMQIMLADVGGDGFLRGFDFEKDTFYSVFNYNDYMALSYHAKVHISGRHHASCLAAISGCPLIGLTANTHKMEGDFMLLDWDIPVFNFYKINDYIDDILHYVSIIIKKNNYYRAKIINRVNEIRKDVKKNVTIVQDK